MHLKRLKITNYKSFFETSEFNFEPGFNVLLGANSSGKTSVLEAIAYDQLADAPHISILNSREPGHIPISKSVIDLGFESSIEETLKLTSPHPSFNLGLGNQQNSFFTQHEHVVENRISNESLYIEIRREMSRNGFVRIGFEDWPSMWRDIGANEVIPCSQIGSNSQISGIQNMNLGNTDIVNIWRNVYSKIYRFHSERAVQPICGHHPNGELHPNSANLAYCINHLQSNNKNLFEKLNFLLNRVFPTIHWISAPPNGSNQFELKVHTTKTDLNRGDLAVPISRVGTGVGNALGMLYVALTAQTQRTILLEEPNSFLHPRALRELLAILSEIGGVHQFFVTTHSSDVLRTIKASTVTLLEHDGQQTSIKQTTGKKLHELQAGLVDLGISLTDLHGCDKVLWVEGETEEAVFPLLLRKYFPEQAQGIAVLPLYATGDFESRKYEPKKVAEIYSRLSRGSFLAPPMVAIALDRERRKGSEITQVEKDCAGIVHFLPKTMLEDYMLDAEAIAAVLGQDSDHPITPAEVTVAFDQAQSSGSCLLNSANPNSSELHAANVLIFVFRELKTLEYHKTSHGPEIVEWLLEHKPDSLAELKAWLANILTPSA